jgi:uncharacterized short protein YbdD (DUF466 family)
MRERGTGLFTSLLERTAQAARLAVGVPNYEAYVEHRRRQHPGEPVMTYEEFYRQRVQARYAHGSTRCC